MERQLRIQRADLLTVAERRDRDRAIHIAKLRRFQQCERRNTLARSQFKCVGNQRIVFISANFYLVGIALAVVSELGFHAAFPDKRVKMSRSSNSQKIVLDDRVEVFLGFVETGDVVKDDLSFLESLCSVRNANLDGVDDRERRISVVDYFYSIIYTRHHNSGHICAVIAVHGFRAATPDKQSALDGHIVQHDFAICRAAADDEVAVHGHILERYIVGANQNAAFDILVVGSLGHYVSAEDVMENLR